jgi:hypothetical protein
MKADARISQGHTEFGTHGRIGLLKYSLANGVIGCNSTANTGYCIIRNFPAQQYSGWITISKVQVQMLYTEHR